MRDGVLAAFDSPAAAIRASMAVQSRHASHLNRWPPPMRRGLRVGMAAGEVVRLSDDVYGEALNLAARLCGLPCPPRMPRAEAEAALPALQMSFLRESRRLTNQRLKRELRLKLRYPTAESGLKAALLLD